MKVKYPAEAFALSLILFSGTMKGAFLSGVLVLLAAVLAEFLKNLLEDGIPLWSLRLCVYVGTGGTCGAAFYLGFAAVGEELSAGLWLMTVLIGLLSARHVLKSSLEADYDGIFWESAFVWGMGILLAAARELLAEGEIFGYPLFQASFQSKSFGDVIFGFLAAGLALAFANAVLKKKCTDTQSWYLAVPMIVFARPFEMVSFGSVIGAVWTIGVSLALFFSVKKTLKFSRTGPAYRGLPAEMLSLGFLYMILSIY